MTNAGHQEMPAKPHMCYGELLLRAPLGHFMSSFVATALDLHACSPLTVGEQG